VTFTWRHRSELHAAVETMIDWNPEHILIAHGMWHDTKGAEELRRAFAWLLPADF
jgi:hypothetical protein